MTVTYFFGAPLVGGGRVAGGFWRTGGGFDGVVLGGVLDADTSLRAVGQPVGDGHHERVNLLV